MNKVSDKKTNYLLSILLTMFLFNYNGNAQTDEDVLKTIYSTSLTNGNSYKWLDHLSNEIGGRLSGSKNAELAVQYTKKELEKLGLDKVWLQPVMVPKWVRGEKEVAYFETSGISKKVNICALGGSVATPNNGLTANLIEVNSYKDLEALGEENIKGKIVFINRPMEQSFIHTFQAYGGCAAERYNGASEAAKYGAIGTIVRSLSTRLDDFPHVQKYH